ncbi:MAG: MFS transporter [Acidobacteriota bacterium]|nr:MFS transporter [Acidobacteriota bacterium]
MNETPKNDRREIFGWVMYDWANSAFLTTVISVLAGPYLTALAQNALGDENGTILDLGWFGSVTALSLFPFAISLSVFGQIFLLPFLGAIADYTRLKKTFMMFFCAVGVLSGCALFFIEGNLYLLGSLLIVISNLAMGGSLVFYNAFLGDICTDDQRDKISSRGYAAGYLGGGLMLLFNLLLLNSAESLGISQGFAVRLSFLIAALWWGGFALISFALVKQRGASRQAAKNENYIFLAFRELAATFRDLSRLRQTALFLIAYLLYNDGIQTVINVSSLFLAQELFSARGQAVDHAFLLMIFLLAQFMGMVGSFAFEFLARRIGAKYSILVSLVIWAAIVIYAYAVLNTIAEAWIMGAAIGFVLGGSQALSRSLFSRMIPEGRESAFFSIYEISERGTSWIGPLVFGAVAAATNSYRQAILALIAFFVIGMILLFLTNTDKAIAQAKEAV